ncbi:hypothetical protein EG850_11085 [Gulosibacter macacae]|uniref:Uncharacterized protein n=1 Tax=Gulosibacter macacae TaxID=2488791 RepID=A0A3P3VSZ3_9MICO|nr:hypothetical protein [Gulosibacter macacae]RRJ85922.1 hypothetical protein EG850_11085 [Gulosibacter macacae]
MSIDRLVTVYENDYGEKAYQPTLPDGTRLVYDYSASWAGEPPDPVWTKIGPVLVPSQRPVLYRSERRAHRKAAREQARRDKRQRQAFREVPGDEQ